MTDPAKARAHWRLRTADAAIRRAFADTPYPGDTAIAQRFDKVPWEIDLEAQAIEAFFAGKTWQQITVEALRDGYSGDPSACLIFMTPAAFRYYLPAFMLIVLQGYKVADMIVDTTLSRLTPQDRLPGPEALKEDRFYELIAPLTLPEREAVAQFLLAMQEAYSSIMLPESWPAVPLHLFWGQYLSEADRALLPPFPGDEIEKSRHQLVAIMRQHRTVGDA